MYSKYLNALFLLFSILFVVQGSCPLTISTPSQPKVCFVLIADVAFVYLYFISVFVYLYLFGLSRSHHHLNRSGICQMLRFLEALELKSCLDFT